MAFDAGDSWTLDQGGQNGLAKESADRGLGVGRQGVEQLVGVQAGGLHEFPGGVDDALGHVSLQGFGLEGLCDVGEALSALGEDCGVGSVQMLVFRGFET